MTRLSPMLQSALRAARSHPAASGATATALLFAAVLGATGPSRRAAPPGGDAESAAPTDPTPAPTPDRSAEVREWRATLTAAIEASRRGGYIEADRLFADALESAGPIAAVQPTARGDVFFQMAEHAARRSSRREAEYNYTRAIETWAAALPPDHELTARARNNLGRLLLAQGRADEAETHLSAAVASLEKSLGPTHPATAAALNNLAESYVLRDQLALAEPLLVRSLEIKRATAPTSDTATALAHFNLARLHERRERWAEAAESFGAAAAIWSGAGSGAAEAELAARLREAALAEAEETGAPAAGSGGR